MPLPHRRVSSSFSSAAAARPGGAGRLQQLASPYVLRRRAAAGVPLDSRPSVLYRHTGGKIMDGPRKMVLVLENRNGPMGHGLMGLVGRFGVGSDSFFLFY